MNELADPRHAWFILGGVLLGLVLTAGFAAWIAKRLGRVLDRAEKMISEMQAVIGQARKIAFHVSEQYAPLKDRIDALEKRVDTIEQYDER